VASYVNNNGLISLVIHKKGRPGAAIEPTICNWKVPGSILSLCTFVPKRLGAPPNPAQCGKPTALGTLFYHQLLTRFYASLVIAYRVAF